MSSSRFPQQPDPDLSPSQVAELVDELDHYRDIERDELLAALTAAAWPTRLALSQ